MQRGALRRSRRELSNAYIFAKCGFDTAENEPSKVWPIAAPPSAVAAAAGAAGRPALAALLQRAAPVRWAGLDFSGCCTARDRTNFTGLVLGCIEATFCKQICVCSICIQPISSLIGNLAAMHSVSNTAAYSPRPTCPRPSQRCRRARSAQTALASKYARHVKHRLHFLTSGLR